MGSTSRWTRRTGARSIPRARKAPSAWWTRSGAPTARRATPETITNFQDATGLAPAATNAAAAIRFNWTTPFLLSPHDPERLYYGSNYLLTSTDQGRSWKIV